MAQLSSTTLFVFWAFKKAYGLVNYDIHWNPVRIIQRFGRIDRIGSRSEDFNDFLAKCAEFGILVDYNPDHKIDLKFMLAAQKERNPRARFTRAKTGVKKEYCKKQFEKYIATDFSRFH